MTKDQQFPCNQCGLCCRYVGLAEETRFLDRGDGTCRNYNTANKTCLIYDERPDICRVDRQYHLNYARQFSWTEFVTLNLQVCEQLQSTACIDDSSQRAEVIHPQPSI